jgi:hypothetical protein
MISPLTSAGLLGTYSILAPFHRDDGRLPISQATSPRFLVPALVKTNPAKENCSHARAHSQRGELEQLGKERNLD